LVLFSDQPGATDQIHQRPGQDKNRIRGDIEEGDLVTAYRKRDRRPCFTIQADRVETLLFGGDEVLIVKDPSDAVMLDIALGLSK
jgi:hypothetical protein